MKKIITALFSTLTLSVFGQMNMFDIGFEGGFSVSSLRGNEIIDAHHDSRIGSSGGVYGQFNFKKVISIRTGAYFESKGSSIEFTMTDQTGQSLGTIKGKQNFDFVTVPLLVRATFGKKLNYFVNVGTYYGFLLKQTESTEGFQDFPETLVDRTHNYKRNEVGISTGLGLSYTFKFPLAISFEVRNNLGLVNISRFPVYNGGTIKTNNLNFLFGACYKLGQRDPQGLK